MQSPRASRHRTGQKRMDLGVDHIIFAVATELYYLRVKAVIDNKSVDVAVCQ